MNDGQPCGVRSNHGDPLLPSSGDPDEELYNYDATRILATDWAAGNTTGGFFGYSTVTVTGNTIDVRWYNTSNVQQKALTFSHSR